MEDSPELVKLLKYLLFGILLSDIILGNGQPLVTEPPNIVPVPFNQPEDYRSDLISSFTGREAFHGMKSLGMQQQQQNPKGDDLDPDASPMSGGHKEVRQAPEPPPGLQQRPPHNGNNHPPPTMVRSQQQFERNNGDDRQSPPYQQQQQYDRNGNSFGSLCSIFRTFLEPRRFHRCHVSNGGGTGQITGMGPPSPPQNDYFERNGPPHPRPLHSNDLNLELNSEGHGLMNGHHHGQDRIQQDKDIEGDEHKSMGVSQQSLQASKRYDHIDDIQINHSGEDNDDHDIPHHHPGLPPPPPPPGHHQHQQDPTKISQDRTMIVVPERTCPPGQRRDPRGYCRRLVKIRTNYQYGPPSNIVRPIPIRYYYSRIVTLPALHFFFPTNK